MSGTNYFATPPRRAAGDPALRLRDERLESLKAVIGKLAHDFNNFLVPQFGYLTLIGEEIQAESTAAQYVKTMESAARTTEGYIESVLLAVRPQRQYAPKEVDLSTILNELIGSWIEGLPKSIEVTVMRFIEPAPMQGDDRHWRKVIEHLLSNARFALALGGELRVTLRPEELGEEDLHRLGLETPAVYCLRFEDTGIGMQTSTVTRAFDPFFSTRPITRGSGLGLTIVHTVTQFHGGQVELESVEDGGTKITLWIPRTPPSTVRIGAAAVLRRGPKKPKVLVVEDEAMAEQVLRYWLATLDFDVHATDTAAAAAKLLGRDPTGFSVVISEAHLKSGPIDALREAVSKVEGLNCIVLAGPGEAVDDASRFPVMKKPATMRAFSELILRVARRA